MKIGLKYLILVGLISTFSILTSCNRDDDEPSSPIVGVWNYSSADIEIIVNGQSFTSFLVQNGASQSQALAAEAFFKNEILQEVDFQGISIEFRADGTYSLRDNGVEEDSGTWELRNNNTLLVLNSKDGDGPEELEVKTLTNNNLSVSFTEEDSFDLTEDGVDEDFKFIFTLNLTK